MGGKHQKVAACDLSLSGVEELGDDVELLPRQRRQLQTEAKHASAVTTVQMSDEQKDRADKAKTRISEAKDGPDLLQKLETLVEEDWLGDITEIEGNIYRLAAFSAMEFRAQFNYEALEGNARLLGCVLIASLQVIGPPAVFLTAAFSYGMLKSQNLRWEDWEPDSFDWQHIKLTKVISMLFATLFALNGAFCVSSEKEAWIKVDTLHKYLDVKTADFHFGHGFMLVVDAFINSWVLLWCTIDAFIVLGGSESPGDAVMDALGLIFLFNLDDMESPLGLVSSDDWPGSRLGWFYKHVVQGDSYSRIGGAGADADADPEMNDPEPAAEEDDKPRNFEDRGCVSKLCEFMYDFTAIVLGFLAIGLPVAIAITSFVKLRPKFHAG
eukprot:NODE_544_length_1488_cov_267.344033.p1 GENE.NODE_544_length_1488_cov_267.344033~~NODE_544_length_1488_cov_267.344033.p1  ORF type:complete len:382 (-),score=151.78 NODE_544_length_1488_cov_267.344033:325-1470(-)